MRHIELTKGFVAIVDDEDFDTLNGYNWHTHTSHTRKLYARRNEGISKIYMHRQLLNAGANEKTDHKDGNGLNNSRDNLRRCTTAQNTYNKQNLKSGRSSLYKGVTLYSTRKTWVAQIMVNYKKIHLGCYSTQEEAALVYNAAALKHFGEFANLNVVSNKDIV